MAYLIKLPSVAADTSGGNLHQWLKQEGDTVAVGDALAEIETEKAIVEINAEHAGVLVPHRRRRRRLVGAGEHRAGRAAGRRRGRLRHRARAGRTGRGPGRSAGRPGTGCRNPRLFELRRHRDLRARHERRARASRPGLGRPAACPARWRVAWPRNGAWTRRASRAAARMAASCAATWKRRATPRPPPASRKPPRCAPPAAACRTAACAAPSPAA
ncbi:lipoyl domain-containing protein [Achromobacter xylosoxidans]